MSIQTPEESKERTERRAEKLLKHTSIFITRTSFFKELVFKIYKKMDTNEPPGLDKDELYKGVLLLHLRLAKYAGPAACNPPSITTVNTMFELFDFDNSGQIEEDEFLDIMIILCSQIATRVFFQWALTILIVPFLARNILAFIVFLVGSEYFKFALVDAMKEGLIKNIVLGLPFTMISTLLTIFGIPAALDYTDSFFFDVAVDLGQGESNKAD